MGKVVIVGSLVACGYLIVKTTHTYNCRMKIMKAILAYQMNCSINGKEDRVSVSDMQSYGKTLFSIFNWGYTKILPKEKFELIKHFIK